VKRFADAMPVFGAESLGGLGSAFFVISAVPFRLERPTLIGGRRPYTLAHHSRSYRQRNLLYWRPKHGPRGRLKNLSA
jgi:hypothetical protein